ncbi:MAG: DUF4397 domain-containing protein [Pseudomonadota bacterium]
MTRHALQAALLAPLLLTLAACGSNDTDDDDDFPNPATVRGLHAMADLDAVTFVIEEEDLDPLTLATLSFKSASGLEGFDEQEYTLRFEILLPDESDRSTIIETDVEVVDDMVYNLVLAGTFAAPELFVWAEPFRDWVDELDDADDNDEDITVLEVALGHAAQTLGPVDVYLESPGTSPNFATPFATLAYGDHQLPIEIDEDTYQLVMTPAGDPETILLASQEIILDAATSQLFAVLDDGGVTTEAYTIRQLGSSLGVDLTDLDAESVLSVVHVATGTDALDVYDARDLAAPLVTDLPFATRSDTVTLADDRLDLVVTPTGNPGAFLEQRSSDVDPASYTRLYLLGLPGDLQSVPLDYDTRTFATHARVRLFHAAVRFRTFDAYLVGPEVDITLANPTYGDLLYGTGTGLVRTDPGEYNLVLTEADTKNIIAGPEQVVLEAGEVIEWVVVDAPDITQAEILEFEGER